MIGKITFRACKALCTQARRKAAGRQGIQGALAPTLLNDSCLAPAAREEADRAEAEAMYSLALARPPPRHARSAGWCLVA